MENSSSKMDVIKPVVLKAGVLPLALTLASFIIAKIATRRFSSPPTSSSPRSKIQKNNHHDEEVKESCDLQEVVLGLENRLLRYQETKEQEIGLMKLQNKMMMEMNKAEFLEREILSLEAEKQRFKDIVMKYLEILRLFEFSRTENKKLHERVQKILRKNKEICWISRKKSLLIECKEKEILENKEELEMKGDCIRLMEDEIRELRVINEELKREKNEISHKLRLFEESVTSKVEGETENYNQLACELDRLKKDETSEVEELTCLRRCNACLRHELMRNKEQEQMEENESTENDIQDFGLANELNRNNVGQNESFLGLTTQNQVHSKRRKLMEKFKRWVEGSEKEKHEKNKRFRRRFVSDGGEEAYYPARKSCSSAGA